MKKLFLPFFLFVLIFSCLVPHASHAAIANWNKGASIVPRWDGDFGTDSFRQSIDALSATGANMVTLVIPYYQSNSWSTDVGRGWNTPTDASLFSAIGYIHIKGMRVNLKPHLDPYDGQWRANINPGDRDSWFGAYGDMLRHYARIGADHGVAQITIGTELIHMTDPSFHSANTENWLNMIESIRSLYGGTLTYSANWGGPGWTDEKNHIEFWHALDSIGISAYFPLPAGDNSPESLRREWHNINMRDITPLQQRIGKPIEFSEIGYRSVSGARYEPFSFWSGGGFDPWEQANLYEALFSYWNDYSFVRGVQLWDWESDPNAGGEGNINYTPQRKQAESVMRRWFGSPAAPNPTPPPSSGNVTFAANATANPAALWPGQTTMITGEVVSQEGTLSDTIVNIEIANGSGEKVHQQFFEHQSFASGERKTYSVAWNAGTMGTYRVRIGVFNNTWAQNYYWNGEAGSIFVTTDSSGGGSPPPQNSASIDIWWPTHEARLSGTQPLKAIVPGREVSSYSMFWQVDGDRLNPMDTSHADYPHKEVWIDVTGWRWKGDGPYRMNFVAETNGTRIAEREILLYTF